MKLAVDGYQPPVWSGGASSRQNGKSEERGLELGSRGQTGDLLWHRGMMSLELQPAILTSVLSQEMGFRETNAVIKDRMWTQDLRIQSFPRALPQGSLFGRIEGGKERCGD